MKTIQSFDGGNLREEISVAFPERFIFTNGSFWEKPQQKMI